MIVLVQLLRGVRWFTRVGWTLGALVLALVTWHWGRFRPPYAAWPLVVFATLAAACVWWLWRAPRIGEPRVRRHAALAALGVVSAHSLTQALAESEREAYPLVLLTVALIGAFARPQITACAVVGTSLMEAFAPVPLEARTRAFHFFFAVAAASISALSARIEVVRVRQRARRERNAERRRVERDARLFRLVTAPTDGAGWDEDRLLHSSALEVKRTLYFTLLLLKRTLKLNTCALFLLSDDESRVEVGELVTESDATQAGPFDRRAGVFGVIVQRGIAAMLEGLKPNYAGLPYYSENPGIRHFLGVPVKEQSITCGALCADRIVDEPFTPEEEEVLTEAARHLVRALENERVFTQLERSKHEQAILYRASQSLGAAMNEEAVVDAALETTGAIATFDFAAVTRHDKGRHVVVRATGLDAERYQGLSFKGNASLTAMVVKNRHYLPFRGDFEVERHVLFTKRANPNSLRSLLVLPLNVREQTIGTLVVGAQREHAFSRSARTALQVLTQQVAVSLANAAFVRRLEELATTDGLTGCLNKRTFLEELEQKLKSAARFGRHLSLVVTDIDHFKSVNDTYGHAAGDIVLRGLGGILRHVKRETDTVARFGGEEFCVLCEETDGAGAALLAERIRQELGSATFQSEGGALQVTCSAGVATFPEDASSAKDLFEVADRALYNAKRSGRNRVCAAA